MNTGYTNSVIDEQIDNQVIRKIEVYVTSLPLNYDIRLAW